MRKRATAMVTGLTLSVTLLVGCSTEEPEQPTTFTATAPVSRPGRPGEPAVTIAPGQTATRAPRPGFNDADVAFAQDMIVHHSQALTMARLAPGRVADPRVRTLAERIALTQEPEAQYLQEWLTSHRQLVRNPEGHHAMTGMVTPQQIEQLTAARAGAFDSLFLTLMVTHHRGAVTMANELSTRGSDPLLQELATDISAGQAAEINRMLDVKATLGG